MTPHEINIAIGKSLGFAQCPIALSHGFPPELCYRKDTYIGELPDFYGSLDRMHEVERSVLAADKDWHYILNLADIVCPDFCDKDDCFHKSGIWTWLVVHATSQQRAEAYLRTLNLWTNTNAPSRQDATVSNPPPSM